MKQIKYTPLRLALIVTVGVLLWLAAYGPKGCSSTISSLNFDPTSSAAHSLYIASPGLSGDFDGLTIFFDESTIVNNRIRVILDGEVRWIRLEAD
jgi:hypothetical protein